MTTHLEHHEHAFVKDGIVINILVFDGHNHTLLNQCKEHFGADEVVCCCDNGIAYIDGTWDGKEFKPKKPYESWIWNGSIWESPVPYPQDNSHYEWNESSQNWVLAS